MSSEKYKEEAGRIIEGRIESPRLKSFEEISVLPEAEAAKLFLFSFYYGFSYFMLSSVRRNLF